MNYFKYTVYIFAALFSTVSYSMHQDSYEFRLATIEDTTNLEHLLAASSSEDRQKIVVLPERIRHQALEGNIQKGRFFVCYSAHHELIAAKKVFVLDDPQELNDTLIHEIRAQDTDQQYKTPEEHIVLNVAHDTATDLGKAPTNLPNIAETLFIYNGADYTHPDHRRKGINTQLTAYALAFLRNTSYEALLNNKTTLCLLYGLVIGSSKGTIAQTRTTSIARAFAHELSCIQSLFNQDPGDESINLSCARFPAFKPEFDQENCTVLPDEQCVPGHGYLLSHQFKEKS